MFDLSQLKYNKFNKNTLFILGEKVIALPLNFLTFIILARYLGLEKFGLMSFGLSILALFAPFSQFAYDTILTKYLSDGVSFKAIVKNAIPLRLLGSSIVYTAIVGLIYLTQQESQIFWFLSIVSLTIFLDSFLIYDSYFQSKLKSKFTTGVRTFAIIVGCSARILLAINGGSLMLIGISFVGEKLIILLLMWLTSKKVIATETVNEKIAPLPMVLFKESLPLIITNILILINFKIDQILIEYFMTTSDVGIYAGAVRFSEVWYMIPTALMASYFPFLSVNIADESLVMKTVLKVSKYLIYISLGIAVVISCTSGFFIDILLGQQYIQTSAILNLHIWASIFFFAGHPISKLLIAKGKTWINLVGKFISAIINFVLNWILIPMNGLQGAAIATLVSYAVGYYFYYFFFSETRPIIWKISKEPFVHIYKLITRVL